MQLPYFYVILHKPSNKRYAGCKFGRFADPTTFMTSDGYQTSSKTVKALIQSDGLDSFKIDLIVTEDVVGNVHEYETSFLKINDCANDLMWINCHNNTIASFGTSEFESMMIKRHGVENIMHSLDYKKKAVTCAAKALTLIPKEERLSWEQRRQASNFKKYGASNLMQVASLREAVKKTWNERYDGHPMRDPSIKARASMKMRSQESQLSRKKTSKERYGVEHHTQRPENRKIVSEAKKRYWNERATTHQCRHCKKESRNPAMIARWHNDNCKQRR